GAGGSGRGVVGVIDIDLGALVRLVGGDLVGRDAVEEVLVDRRLGRHRGGGVGRFGVRGEGRQGDSPAPASQSALARGGRGNRSRLRLRFGGMVSCRFRARRGPIEAIEVLVLLIVVRGLDGGLGHRHGLGRGGAGAGGGPGAQVRGTGPA